MGTERKGAIRFVGHALAGSAAVLLVAYLGVRLHVNFSTTGFLDLLIVVLVATISGFWEATVTSLAALTCLNYFFVPPVYTLYVSDPQNWVALITFESTAFVGQPALHPNGETGRTRSRSAGAWQNSMSSAAGLC